MSVITPSKKKRIVVALLSLTLISSSVAASDISNINGSNGIFNIDPSGINGDIGFRHYENFNLSQGDIANLIFKYGAENVSKFVNFVDNTININGLINTMRDGNFYNGHAIFVSPNGMVVGASGVLNVGSLSVLTPAPCTYSAFTNEMSKYASVLSKPGTPEYEAAMALKGNGTIQIDGKILARDSINLSAKDIAVNNGALLMAGVNNSDVIGSNAQAEILFNQLVNTSAMSANSFL